MAIKVLPEHVGVFYELKTQQFQAIAIFADGTEEDYTEKVGWSIAAYPFSNQTSSPEEVATIDRHGLATVHSKWGRVKVKATYPPPANFSPKPIVLLLLTPQVVPEPKPKPVVGFLPAIYLLLLADDPVVKASVYSAMPTGNSDVLTSRGDSKVAKELNLVPFERNQADSFH